MTDGSDRSVQCVCGSREIEPAYWQKWKCNGCGRFHDGDAMDRLAVRTPPMKTGGDQP